MTTAQEAEYGYWRAEVGRLHIDATARLHGNAVTRMSRNRYIVRVNGEIHEVGGRRMDVYTCQALVLSLIREKTLDGQADVLLCLRCKNAPRTNKCYCKRCYAALRAEYEARGGVAA